MPVSITTGEPCELDRHMKLLDTNFSAPSRRGEIETAPIFTPAVRKCAQTLFGSGANIFSQYGFLGGVLDNKRQTRISSPSHGEPERIRDCFTMSRLLPASSFAAARALGKAIRSAAF